MIDDRVRLVDGPQDGRRLRGVAAAGDGRRPRGRAVTRRRSARCARPNTAPNASRWDSLPLVSPHAALRRHRRRIQRAAAAHRRGVGAFARAAKTSSRSSRTAREPSPGATSRRCAPRCASGPRSSSPGASRPASIGQACDALRELPRRDGRAKVDAYRAIATSAVREAKNGATLVERARREAGIELETIEGIEEARLIQLAVTRRHARSAKSGPCSSTWAAARPSSRCSTTARPPSRCRCRSARCGCSRRTSRA